MGVTAATSTTWKRVGQGQGQHKANHHLLLLSANSFRSDENGVTPSHKSLLFTGAFIVFFLYLVELGLRLIISLIQDAHPLMQDETNRNILARHIGVDAFCCFAAAYLGWSARNVLYREFYSKAPENRLYKYEHQVAQLLLYFAAFQLKNFFDSWKWNDGPEFLAHHILAMGSALGAIIPSPSFHFYAVFYMGISESSTAILCLLVNFDDEHGVVGLGDAFPMWKTALGGFFAVLFVSIRVIAWSIFTKKYYQDVLTVSKSDSKYVSRRYFIQFNNVSLGLVTILQIVWTYEIYRVMKLELAKLATVS